MGALRSMYRASVSGMLALCAVNLSASFSGVALGFSWLSGGVAVVLGVPGVISMLLMNALFLIG
jgi:inhibitor of the pro-sigma K processing machinery